MCVQKQKLFTRIGQSLIALKNKITSGDVLKNIRHRVKQQCEARTEDSNVICSHMPNYTWEMAFQKLEDQQNSGVSGFSFQDDDLRSVYLYTLTHLEETMNQISMSCCYYIHTGK